MIQKFVQYVKETMVDNCWEKILGELNGEILLFDGCGACDKANALRFYVTSRMEGHKKSIDRLVEEFARYSFWNKAGLGCHEPFWDAAALYLEDFIVSEFRQLAMVIGVDKTELFALFKACSTIPVEVIQQIYSYMKPRRLHPDWDKKGQLYSYIRARLETLRMEEEARQMEEKARQMEEEARRKNEAFSLELERAKQELERSSPTPPVKGKKGGKGSRRFTSEDY